jgi:Fe-S oxidoreductase
MSTTVDETSFTRLEEQLKSLMGKARVPDIAPDERVRRAKRLMLEKLDSRSAMDLETCVHCGMCAEACHFYEATRDPKYTPIHKAYLLRKVYRRELSPVRLVNRLLVRDITSEQLSAWQELVYNSCNDCGRCDMICPMGINISRAIRITREALDEAGLTPPELRVLEQEQAEHGTLLGIGLKELDAAVAELCTRGLTMPLDKPKADVMVLTTALDLVLYKESFAATAKILNHLKVDWTLQHAGFEAANYGMLAGDHAAQARASQRIVDAAIACGAKIVITPECGHAYPALRWEAANELEKQLPFEVMAISEYIGREIEAGRLKVQRVAGPKKVTYHDPCKLGRHGGVLDEPRATLKALGVELKEMDSHGTTQYCCGGGGGVLILSASEPLRRRVFAIKQHQVEDTGASSLVTTCDTCRTTFLSGARKVSWETPIESLVELVAANLA